MDLNDPAARLELIERVDPDEYNRQMLAWQKSQNIESCNGYTIRGVSSRFGRLFAVIGTPKAFATIEGARAHANSLDPAKEQKQ